MPGKLRWFAAEFLVVVTGVLVALAVQAVYQRIENENLKDSYLQQLMADLRATDAEMLRGDSGMVVPDHSATLLLRAYRTANVPADSIITWLATVSLVHTRYPVLGTAEALVGSGDIRLIRDDSVRAAIINYTSQMRAAIYVYQSSIERFWRGVSDLRQEVDLAEASNLRQGRGTFSVDAAYRTVLPPYQQRGPFGLQPAELLRNRSAYAALSEINAAKAAMAVGRRRVREATAELRARIEANLEANRQGQ